MATIGERDISLDMARGLIMVLMALDHSRIFFTSAQFDPVSVEDTTVGYFVTRWATHLCAPGFFFLAGLGASLGERAGVTGVRASLWLATRGLWLIALEFTVIAFAWSFTLGWSWFGVIASLGACMMCLAALRWLPKFVIGAIAIGFIATHNALPMRSVIGEDGLYALLYGAGVMETAAGAKIVLFPIIPWLAVMALGYAIGPWLTPDRRASPRRFAGVGLVGLALFVILRLVGVGQPSDGGAVMSPAAAQTAMSFFNVEKYPPSLQFLAVTLGALSLLVAAFAWTNGKRRELARATGQPRFLLTFGLTPFLFYVLHLYVIHGLALATAFILGWPMDHVFWRDAGPNLTPPQGYGFELWGIYLTLLFVLVVLYPACAWLAARKARSRVWWLRYV